MKITVLALAFFSVGLLAAVIHAQELKKMETFKTSHASGKSIYLAQCAACHGGNAKGLKGFSPLLAGQHADYLKAQIKDIRDGKRTNGRSLSMVSTFKSLKEIEINQIVNYLEDLK